MYRRPPLPPNAGKPSPETDQPKLKPDQPKPPDRQGLQIGPRIEESSRKECNDFMGVLITGDETKQVIIRQFHDLPASLAEDKKDGKIRVLWGTRDPREAGQDQGEGVPRLSLIDRYRHFHETLKECKYVQKMLDISKMQVDSVWQPSLCVVDAISHNPPTLSSQDEPWFLLMMLTCLEDAHRKNIYHRNIDDKNISWNLSGGSLDVALANWIDAEEITDAARSWMAEKKDVEKLLEAMMKKIFVDTGTLARKLLEKVKGLSGRPKQGELLSTTCKREVLGLNTEWTPATEAQDERE